MNRTHPYKLALGDRANTILVAIVSRNHIEPEQLLRVMCETELALAENDQETQDDLINDVGILNRDGTLEPGYWGKTKPRFDGLLVDRSEAQEEAPDDVPVYEPPEPCLASKPRPHRVTVEFDDLLYSGLHLIKAYDEQATIGDVIRREAAADLGAVVDATGFREWLKEAIEKSLS